MRPKDFACAQRILLPMRISVFPEKHARPWPGRALRESGAFLRDPCARLADGGQRVCECRSSGPNFASRREPVHSGDSDAACARARRARSPAGERRRAQRSTPSVPRRRNHERSRSGRAIAGREPCAPSRRDRRTFFHAESVRAPALLQRRSAGRPPLPPPLLLPAMSRRGAMIRATARSVPHAVGRNCAGICYRTEVGLVGLVLPVTG